MSTAVAFEEPTYRLLKKASDYELRAYPSYIVAEVTVETDAARAGNAAFGTLAAYIGGANRAARVIEMTAPVTQQAADRSDRPRAGQKIPMTAPVTQTAKGPGAQVVQFIMPADFTLDTTPAPTDSRVRIRKIEARVVAVRRYSGRWTMSNLESNDRALQAALVRDKVEVTGPMEWARFDSPFRLWFLRRNEVWYPVAEVDEAG